MGSTSCDFPYGFSNLILPMAESHISDHTAKHTHFQTCVCVCVCVCVCMCVCVYVCVCVSVSG